MTQTNELSAQQVQKVGRVLDEVNDIIGRRTRYQNISEISESPRKHAPIVQSLNAAYNSRESLELTQRQVDQLMDLLGQVKKNARDQAATRSISGQVDKLSSDLREAGYDVSNNRTFNGKKWGAHR